jgi:hypothetical protein
VLFIESKDFTDGWAIYSDNIAMARWFQTTQLTASTPSDTTIPVIEASFESSGDPRDYWTETCTSQNEVIEMTWTGILDPVINHTQAAPDAFGVWCAHTTPLSARSGPQPSPQLHWHGAAMLCPSAASQSTSVCSSVCVSTTLIPCNEARITVNGKQLENRSFPSEDPTGLPEFTKCTAFLAFCETWTEVKGPAL